MSYDNRWEEDNERGYKIRNDNTLKHRLKNNVRFWQSTTVVLAVVLIISLIYLLVLRLQANQPTTTQASMPTSVATQPQRQGISPAAINPSAGGAPTVLVPTSMPTPAMYTPGTVICRPDWSNGLQGWSATSDWFVQDGQLLNNGQGSDPGAPTLIPPCQSQLAGIRDYKIVITMQLLQASSGHFGIEARGTTSSNGWRGYNALIQYSGCSTCGINNISIKGTAQDSSVDGFIPDINKNTYSLEAKGYYITYKVNDASKISVDDLAYPSGTDIGFLCSGFQLRIFDIEIIAL